MKWWWTTRGRNGRAAAATAAAAAAEVAAQEQVELAKAAERMTPIYHRLAPAVAELSDDEFAERVRAAFRRRPA